MMRALDVVASICLIGVVADQANAQFPGPNPALPQWKLGNMWNLEVTSYPRKQSDGSVKKDASFPDKPFHMRVIINGTETIGPMTSWRIMYTAGLDAPNHIKDKQIKGVNK